MRKNTNFLKVYIDEQKADILCIIDHWCKKSDMENMYIPGYLNAASIFKKENIIYEETKSITNPPEEIVCKFQHVH